MGSATTMEKSRLVASAGRPAIQHRARVQAIMIMRVASTAKKCDRWRLRILFAFCTATSFLGAGRTIWGLI